ncbi:hypothetical protein Bca4012_020039 [Brassica carinata]
MILMSSQNFRLYTTALCAVFSNMFHRYAGETLDTLKRAIHVRDATAKSKSV